MVSRKLAVAVVFALLCIASCACAQVKVLGTYPQAGAKNVDSNTKQIRIRFSEPVDTGGWSLVSTNEGLSLELTGRPSFIEKNTVCLVPVVLYPGLTYSVSINSERFNNFRSAADPNVAVTPYMLTFTTSGKKPTGAAAEVTVVKTYPTAGADNVDPTLRSIRVKFSGPVRTDGWSFVTTDFGKEIPSTGRPSFSEGNTLCELPVKLEPNTKYAVSINGGSFSGFRNAKNPDVPVTSYLLTFTTAAKSSKNPTEQWRDDLSYLAAELPRRHKNLFFKLSEEQFRKMVADLDARIPKLEDYQIRAEMLKLVAAVGDPHTGIDIWKDGRINTLPLSLYWLKDGIYVVSASENYKQMLGCKLESIGGTDIDKACSAVAPLIAHANDAELKKVAPRFLTMPELLRAVNVVSDAQNVEYRVIQADGKSVSVAVKPLEPGKNVPWVPAFDKSKTPVPLYQSRRNARNWVEYVKDGNLVYFFYGECSDTPEHPFEDVRKQVENLLAANKGSRLVIDVRENGGGSSPVLDPFIDWIKTNTELNKKEKLFVVIGRRTFSSAILNADRLRAETRAIFVGEPTGGSPNHYGQVKAFDLPNTGCSVSYSTKYFKYLDDDKPSLEPDILAELTFADYMAGRDPALEAIRKVKDGT